MRFMTPCSKGQGQPLTTLVAGRERESKVNLDQAEDD
jgi:hypothetical protein